MRDLLIDKGVDPGKIALIPPWADADELEPLPRDANPLRDEWGLRGKLVVMYSGNLGLAHDIDTMRGAMEALMCRDDVRFVFVGGGKHMAQLQTNCEAQGMINVIFKPYQPREAIRASLSLADLHLISQADAMTGLLVPSKLYGIMAAGRASVFIGNARAEVARVLAETGSGRVVAVGDVDALTEMISTLAEDPDACRRMGEAARLAMDETYDRRHACEAWEELLTECVSGHRPDVTTVSRRDAAGLTSARAEGDSR
jgi:glycosyltransferase involved in cell wall biosynthesis